LYCIFSRFLLEFMIDLNGLIKFKKRLVNIETFKKLT